MEDFTQLKRHPPEGAVMWGEYLTYATALGVADKVLDKLHENGMITETQYSNYHGIYIAGASFNASYASSTGGGGGGMGGGGGGGGGGGR
ncbi:DUF2207 domain-containing protein, partial [Candidatus Micrarchaeota archaeon]|nr:DUF2207 domain-containing protein [Candidatus Micrarchaeota archaeon]